MTEINHRFAEAVTQASFSLTLSKPMIAYLACIGYGYAPNFRVFGMSGTEVAANRQLLNRGLVYAPNPDWPGATLLTEAGKHVFELLKISGIIVQFERSIEEDASKFHKAGTPPCANAQQTENTNG